MFVFVLVSFFSMMFSMISLAPSTDKEAWQPLGVLRLNLKGERRRGEEGQEHCKGSEGGLEGERIILRHTEEEFHERSGQAAPRNDGLSSATCPLDVS